MLLLNIPLTSALCGNAKLKLLMINPRNPRKVRRFKKKLRNQKNRKNRVSANQKLQTKRNRVNLKNDLKCCILAILFK